MKDIKIKITPVLEKYAVIKAAIFGSYARGEFKTNSDLDMLVEVKKESDLFDFIGLKLELEDVLKRQVDLVEFSALKPLLKERILNEQILIYQK